MQITLLHLMSRDLAFHYFFQAAEEIAQVIGMGDSLKGHPLKLVLGITHDLAKTLINLHPSAIRSDQRHADRSVIERAAKSLFAFLHFREVPFGLFRLRCR